MSHVHERLHHEEQCTYPKFGGRQMGEHHIPMKFENLRHLGEIQQQQKYYISSQESQRTTEIV